MGSEMCIRDSINIESILTRNPEVILASGMSDSRPEWLDPVYTFYQVWNSPLRTINGGHIISDAIELCGGVNIYAGEPAIAPIINIESILTRNPEVILASGMSDSRPEWLDEWKKWPSLSAVKSDNLYFVDPDHIQRHTARILNGIHTICGQLQNARDKRG